MRQRLTRTGSDILLRTLIHAMQNGDIEDEVEFPLSVLRACNRIIDDGEEPPGLQSMEWK